MKGKEGGKCLLSNYEMQVLRIAERFHKLPEEIEKMDEYWFNRTLLLMSGEYERDKTN